MPAARSDRIQEVKDMSISNMIAVWNSECNWNEIDVSPSTIKCVLLAVCETGLSGETNDLFHRLLKMTSVNEDVLLNVFNAGLKRGVLNFIVGDFNPQLIDSGRIVFNFDSATRSEPVEEIAERDESPKAMRERAIRAERKRVTKRVRYEIFQKFNNRCAICGRSASDGAVLHVDHILAIANGGTSDVDNLQVLCEDCNIGKGAL